MNATVKKIEEILRSSYDTKKYVDLIREIFSNASIVAPDRFRKEFTNFSTHIEGSIHVGNCRTTDGKNIIIMSVQLKNAGYVENSRSTQRSYAKKLIENANADAAFIAFYTEGEPKWRLSFVRLDYEMKIKNGHLKAIEKLTPAKRYSYLVGENEPCHTAISRFERFIIDSMANSEHPTLDDLENTFSVEKVTDEFFKLYCEKYHQLREKLEENEDFCIEAQQHNFTSAQFAKKLMGQIVFLYFLQKKGWLGVGAWPKTLNEKEYKHAFFARGAKSRELIPIIYRPVGNGTYCISRAGLNSISDEDEAVLAMCVKGRAWGSGPHNFMRKIFEIAEKKHQNFFDDLLEPLFYDALNVNRGEQGYCPALHCRIPFLSGGLFEPIDGYDWEHNDFNIPNEVFSNAAAKGREADGILDIFDRYNFTMSEDEPLEREVAIDPEMLGKVFENLLEVNDRKSKGAFYTPREIVHYMCQESLINYLTNTLQIEEEAIREFILYGDFMKDEDTVKEKRQGNGEMYISEKLFKLDSDGKVIVDRLKDMDEALKNVRVADPAVGSGAFPLGMLNEIVRARQNISAYMGITMNSTDKRMMYQMDRSPHNLKYETIKNCIFAADIEPSAVDIAQLRLWLSLVIDDEINPNAQSLLDGHKNPLPLPNLECNILCGNSLIDEFEGYRLIDKSILLGDVKYQTNINTQRFDALLNQLMDNQEELFKCENTNTKTNLLKNIAAIRESIIMTQFAGASDKTIEHYKESTRLASKPYVLWQLDFARVFREKGGFDIVIGNPPYIQLQKCINEETGEKLGDQFAKCGYKSFVRTGDIYCLFYEKGYGLLRENGILTFITSNKWMRAGYGKNLRDFFAKNTNPLSLVDFAGQKIFESATVDVSIFMFSKDENKGNTLAAVATEDCRNNLSVFIQLNNSKMSYNSEDSWTILTPIEQSIKEKIEYAGTPLKDWDIKIYRGILTGCNEAFIISGAKKDELLSKDPKSAEIIRPILRGRDIKRYGYDFADLWVINTHNGDKTKKIPPVNICDYPAIKAHLDQYYEKLAKRADKGVTPYNMRNCAYMDDFNKQKIIFQEMVQSPSFMLDADKHFLCLDTGRIIVGKHIKYLLALMNGNLFFFAIKNFYGGGSLGSSGVRMKHTFFEKFNAIIPDEKTLSRIEGIVDDVQKSSSIDEETNCLLNFIINKLYGLTENEINYIESTVLSI